MSKKRLHRNVRKSPRNPNLVFAALWMMIANAALFTLWRFGFVPIGQHIFFTILAILGGAAIGVTLMAIRRTPRNQQGGV